MEHAPFVRIFHMCGRCGNRKGDAPTGIGHGLGDWFFFHDDWCLGGGWMTDYVTSGPDMRKFAFRMRDKVRNSLQHPLLDVFRNLSDVRQILSET